MKVSKHKNKKSGLTVLEMMVAIGIFTMIITIGIGSILATNVTRNKTESQRKAIDTLTFVMEDMTRNLRLARGAYRCMDPRVETLNDEEPADCLGGKLGIAYEPYDGNGPDNPDLSNQEIYWIDPGRGLMKSYDGGQTSVVLVLEEEFKFNIAQSGFNVIGSEPGISDGRQPRVIIRMAGETVGPGPNTVLNLQSTVSRRLIDQ